MLNCEGQACSGIAVQKFGTEIFLQFGLDGAHDGCQAIGLGNNHRDPLSSGDLVVRLLLPNEYSGFWGDLVIPSMLDISSAWSSNQGSVRYYHCSNILMWDRKSLQF